MITPPRSTAQPEISRLSIKSWNKGYISAMDAGRMPNSGLLKMTNAMLRQNGTVAPRPGTRQYGDTLPGEILGFDEYVEIVGNKRVTKLLAIVKDGERAHAYTALDGKNWVKIDGADYNGESYPTFTQVRDRVVITNSKDYLSYYDIQKKKNIRPEALPTVTGVKAEAVGMAGTNETLYYCVTAVKNGETARSDSASVKVSKGRTEWRGKNVDKTKGQAEEYVKITWNKIKDAEYYILYCGISPTSLRMMDIVGQINDTASTQSYEDVGQKILNPNVIPPNSNSTAGVKAARSVLVASRLYLLGDEDDPWKITFGGADPDTMLDFSAFAGGYIRINAGSKEIPVAMRPFRNGKGDAVPMVLCSETNGNGSLKYLQSSSMQLDSTNIQWISVIDDNGRDGTDAPDSVVVYNNALIYISKTGFKTTLTKPQMQNVLSTDNLTDNIQPDVERLNSNFIHKSIGLEVNGMIYFAVPVGSEKLNQLWVLDMKRGGVWCMPWVIGDINDLKVYGSSDGKTRVLLAIGDKLIELTDEVKMTDSGKPFITDIGSGVVKFSEDGAMWTSLVDITFILLKPTGTINFSVSGKTEDEPLQPFLNFSKNFTPKTVPIGWCTTSGWNSPLGWGFVPKKYKSSSGEVRLSITKDIDEDVNWIQYSVAANEAGADFELSDVIIQHIPIGVIFEEDEDE